MQYVIAIAEGRYIYWMHNKIYMNEKQAINARNRLVNSGKINQEAQVYQVTNWILKPVGM